MRISDWSSDVCSSDLRQSSIAVVQARPFFPSMFIEQEPQIPSRQDLRKVTVLSTSFLILISASSPIGPHSSRSTSNVYMREIGRAACRERVCQYVSISVYARSLTNKQSNTSL